MATATIPDSRQPKVSQIKIDTLTTAIRLIVKFGKRHHPLHQVDKVNPCRILIRMRFNQRFSLAKAAAIAPPAAGVAERSCFWCRRF